MIYIEIIDIQINALKYPMQDIKKLLILGVIIFFSFLILPIFLALGYCIRVMKNTTEGNDILPEFDNIGSMFIDGVKYFVVNFVDILITLIIIGIGLIPVFVFRVIAAGDLGPIIVIYSIFVIIIVPIITEMIKYMAVVHMAHTGEFGAAFRVNEIIQRIKNIGIGTYILWFITFIITFVIVSIPLGIIMIISILGIIFVLPILGIILVILIGYPYLFLFMSKSMASIYMKGS